jgi:hypothetical protein
MSSSTEENELAPVRYARQFYELLKAEAQLETTDGTELMVWRGKLTDVFRELKVTSKYYTTIRAILTKTGSITIVETGSRNRPSIVVLNHPPPSLQKINNLGLTGTAPAATMMAELQRRISTLESWRETQGGINIAEALRNIEDRLTKLEAE